MRAGELNPIDIGMDRVLWLRFVTDCEAPYCEVHGTRHRRPATVSVSLSTGLSLKAAGVPALVQGDD